MRILVLSNFAMGLYKFRKELFEELIRQKYEVIISSPYDKYVTLLKELGCKYIESKVDRRGTNLIKDIALLNSYIKIIKRVNPNLVLTYTVKPNIFGGIACRFLNKPYLTNITGLGTSIENMGILRKIILFLYKIALKKSSCIFFQNEANNLFFTTKRIVQGKTKIIPGSGVNLIEHRFEEYPESDKTIRFLFIGRIMKEKGIEELFEAANEIKKDYSNILFDAIGFCETEYSERAKDLEKKGIITFHGEINDIHEYIKNCHAVILPSYHEGMANALLEAASTGRPVLASNIPGCKESFDDNISGFGFRVRDAESLVNAIKKFIELPYERKKSMGYEGRRKMKREFDRKIIIDAYLEEINKITAKI